jgi:ElaB/YqjD/DUF883 family membrane-anchored ribosome-binding protein
MHTNTPPYSSTPAPRDVSEVSERAHAGIDRLRDSAHETVDRATETVSSAAHGSIDSVAGSASAAADSLGRRGEEWRATTDEWTASTREYVREHPLSALGLAFTAGYLLSRLTGR